MEHSLIGGPEIIIILLVIFGLWWLLSFLPKKATLIASTILVAFTPAHQLPNAPTPAPLTQIQNTLLL